MTLFFITKKGLTCPSIANQRDSVQFSNPLRCSSLSFASISLCQTGIVEGCLRSLQASIGQAGQTPRTSLPPFASLSFNASPASTKSMTEPKTGLAFDGEFCLNDAKKNCAKLTGVGCRIKSLAGIKVKVYAAGIYLDNKVAKVELGKYSSLAKADKLKESVEMFEDVINSAAMQKTLQLVFARNLKGASVRDALSERLKPKLGGSTEYKDFQSYFDGVQLKKGQNLSFSSVNGVLTTQFEGKTLGCINSPALCEALFDIYLGSNPVSKELKENLALGVAQILA